MKYPSVYTLGDLFEVASGNRKKVAGLYVPSRPVGVRSVGSRLRAAWLVFTGKADAVKWPAGQ